MKSEKESAPVPKSAPPCGCGYAVFYFLLIAVAAVVSLQWSVDPTVGGVAGFIGSALRLPPSGTWAILGVHRGWLGCGKSGRRIVHGIHGRGAPLRRAGHEFPVSLLLQLHPLVSLLERGFLLRNLRGENLRLEGRRLGVVGRRRASSANTSNKYVGHSRLRRADPLRRRNDNRRPPGIRRRLSD